MTEFCGVCDTRIKSAERGCIGAFARIGITKVHWECWSACNLHCNFCYRTEDAPLDFDSARGLIEIAYAAGVKRLVFAGGDPSLRPDLAELISYAHSLGLLVELQSNFQILAPKVRELISGRIIELSGLSLDAASSESHDSFRSTRGNFNAVMRALNFHEMAGAPVIVRTIVTRLNWEQVARVGTLLTPFSVIKRWSLLEFTPVGHGSTNSRVYSLDSNLFDEAASRARESYQGPAEIDIYRSRAKLGTYGLITASGNLYGVTTETVNGRYPIVGSMLSEHLSHLAAKLPFSRHRHNVRYGH